jgi:hypothetical protein
MKFLSKIVIGFIGLSFLVACTSSQIKARKAMRDQESQTSKLYCDFINGEQYPDIEVQVNLEMAKRCDPEKNMTMTGYRSPSEAIGIVYCCGIKKDAAKDLAKDSKTEKH